MQFSHIIGLHQHVAKHLEKAILWAWDICVKDDSRGKAVLDVYVVHLQLKKSLDFGDNGEESLGRVHLIDFVHPLGLVVHLNLVDLHELGKSEDQRVVVPQPAGGGAPRSPPWGSRSH